MSSISHSSSSSQGSVVPVGSGAIRDLNHIGKITFGTRAPCVIHRSSRNKEDISIGRRPTEFLKTTTTIENATDRNAARICGMSCSNVCKSESTAMRHTITKLLTDFPPGGVDIEDDVATLIVGDKSIEFPIEHCFNLDISNRLDFPSDILCSSINEYFDVTWDRVDDLNNYQGCIRLSNPLPLELNNTRTSRFVPNGIKFLEPYFNTNEWNECPSKFITLPNQVAIWIANENSFEDNSERKRGKERDPKEFQWFEFFCKVFLAGGKGKDNVYDNYVSEMVDKLFGYLVNKSLPLDYDVEAFDSIVEGLSNEFYDFSTSWSDIRLDILTILKV